MKLFKNNRFGDSPRFLDFQYIKIESNELLQKFMKVMFLALQEVLVSCGLTGPYFLYLEVALKGFKLIDLFAELCLIKLGFILVL